MGEKNKKTKKKTWGRIVTFSDENVTKQDLGLGKQCQAVVRIQMFWGEWQEGYSEGSKEQGQNRLKRGQVRLSGETAHYRLCVNGRHNKVLFKSMLFTG